MITQINTPDILSNTQLLKHKKTRHRVRKYSNTKTPDILLQRCKRFRSMEQFLAQHNQFCDVIFTTLYLEQQCCVSSCGCASFVHAFLFPTRVRMCRHTHVHTHAHTCTHIHTHTHTHTQTHTHPHTHTHTHEQARTHQNIELQGEEILSLPVTDIHTHTNIKYTNPEHCWICVFNEFWICVFYVCVRMTNIKHTNPGILSIPTYSIVRHVKNIMITRFK